MVRLILHIGMHKCGSTFIQNTLYENGDVLQRHGILYPRTGLLLSQVDAGRRHTRITAAAKEGDPDALLFRELRREVDTSGAETVVISHEGMSEPGIRPEVLHHVFRDFDTTIVVYGRSPAGQLESRFRSSIRTNGFSAEIDDYIAMLEDRLDVRSLLGRWRDVFGPSKIRFFSFDALPRGTPLANHLLQAGGVSLDPLPPARAANVRDSNGKLLLRLLANRIARAADIPPVRLRFRDVDFVYGSNEGRLISDAALAKLEPAMAAYRQLLAEEGQPPLTDRLSAQPYDAAFFDPKVRAEANRIAESIVQRAREGDKGIVARALTALKQRVSRVLPGHRR